MDDIPLEPEKKGIPGWAIALIVVGALMFFCAPVGGAALILVPKIQMQQKKAACADQLRHLGALRAVGRVDVVEAAEPDGGVRFLLRLLDRAGGDSKQLICPGDPHAAPGRIVAVGDGKQDPATAPIYRAMCSYMVRDFARYPLDASAALPEILAADANDHGAHHKGGIHVLYADGSVKFMDREALGIPADELIIVGPDSTHPELKKLCIVPAR